jgi:short subunit dehydrogenase-like uncharacterized protein
VTRIGVLGAEGFTGGLLVEELSRHGHEPVPLDDAPLRAGDAATLRTALTTCDLAISTLGPGDPVVRAVVDAAIATGTHLVDLAGDPATLRWAAAERDAAAREAGVTVVVGAGFASVPGDPLAHLAGHALTSPREVHVCYAFPSAGGFLAALSGGTRRAIAERLGEPGLAVHHGELVEELPGETRRLAWFPRPVGPAHAAGVPGPEPLTVPQHVPSARTVRTYLALTSWRAELLQAAGSLARWRAGRRFLERRLTARRAAPTPARRSTTRWACVAEAAGEEGVARAWAYGTDPYGTGAAAAVALAEAVVGGHADAGVIPPSLTEVPAELLDTLSARTDLRWAISRPSTS